MGLAVLANQPKVTETETETTEAWVVGAARLRHRHRRRWMATARLASAPEAGHSISTPQTPFAATVAVGAAVLRHEWGLLHQLWRPLAQVLASLHPTNCHRAPLTVTVMAVATAMVTAATAT